MGKKKGPRPDDEGSAPRYHRSMLVSDVVDSDPRAQEVLLEFGLPCHRCIVAWHETLAEGCAPLGIRIEQVLERLNALEEA